MEVITTTTVPAGPPDVATNYHSFLQHHIHSRKHYHNHDNFPFKTILITISVVTLITVLFIIFLVVCLIRRKKSSSSDNESCKDDIESRALHDTSSRLIASTMLTFNSSPDVKGGCLHGGNLNRTPTTPKFRGVQVLTYKELEVATDGFSEANVIGNGMYKGVLSDGSLAAIKLLSSEGKQGECGFRIEVSEWTLSPASYYLAIGIGKELNFRYQHMLRLDKYIESYFTFSIKSYFTFFCKDIY